MDSQLEKDFFIPILCMERGVVICILEKWRNKQMKIALQIILLISLSLSLKAWADDPNYDLNTGIVYFPRVTVDNSEAFINVDLLLSQDGTWDILAFEPEPESLTGDWSGSTFGYILGVYWIPLQCKTELFEVSLTQNGNEVTGEATFVDGCHAGQSGTIIGSVSDIGFRFDLTLEDETVMKFEGTIAHDFCALGGSYSYFPDPGWGDESGHWALSCQK